MSSSRMQQAARGHVARPRPVIATGAAKMLLKKIAPHQQHAAQQVLDDPDNEAAKNLLLLCKKLEKAICEDFKVTHKRQHFRKWFSISSGWNMILLVVLGLAPAIGITIWLGVAGFLAPYQAYAISVTLACLLARPLGDFWQRQVDARHAREATLGEEVQDGLTASAS